VLSSSHPPFDLPSHVRHSQEKVNGNGRAASYISVKAGQGEESEPCMDGRNGVKAHTNGDIFHDAPLNTLPNGRSSMNSWDHRSSRNGSTLSVNGTTNGGTENGRRSPGPQNGLSKSNGDRTSVASTINAYPQPPTDYATIPSTNGDSEPPKKIAIPPAVSTNPQSTGPLTYTSSLIPSTPVAPSEFTTPTRANTTSPHRFSSPPSYPPPPVPSPSAHSLPPHSASLQHRHTLQVPKLGGSRNSRDGDDVIYASGRFSPTGIVQGARRGSLSLNRRHTQSIHSNMPHEEIPVDEDAMRWAEAVRQKRASKRKRKDDEDDDRVVVGTKVDQNHVNWVTAYNMLTGIRFTVSRTNAKLDRPLTDADFDAKHKFSFDM